MFRKVLPAILLMLLSPLIAEYVLGNLPTDKLYYLPALCLMYGAGAVLVREMTKRLKRGWLPFVFLAAAYGLMEEGLVTQSLFNPDYMHLRLLDYGFVSALHTALPWAIYAVSIHVIWSLAVPIGLLDALFPARRDEPWLGTIGLIVIGLLFVAGTTWLGLASIRRNEGVTAAPAILLTTGAIIAALAGAAFLVPRPRRGLQETDASQPILYHPVMLAIVAFVTGSAFQLSHACGNKFWHWPWHLTITVMVIWIGFLLEMKLYGSRARTGHILLDAVVLVIFAVALFQTLSQIKQANGYAKSRSG